MSAGTAKRDGVIALVLAHGGGGHDQDLVGVEGAGLVGLGPAHHDAVRLALHHVHEHVRVGLLGRAQAAVALDVGHGPVHHHVLLLDEAEVVLEPVVVVGAVRLVALVGDRVQGVEAVHAHAALEAGGGPPAQQALHEYLVHQVVRALVDVGEAADLLPAEVGLHEEQVLRLGLARPGCRSRRRRLSTA